MCVCVCMFEYVGTYVYVCLWRPKYFTVTLHIVLRGRVSQLKPEHTDMVALATSLLWGSLSPHSEWTGGWAATLCLSGIYLGSGALKSSLHAWVENALIPKPCSQPLINSSSEHFKDHTKTICSGGTVRFFSDWPGAWSPYPQIVCTCRIPALYSSQVWRGQGL